MTSVPDPTTSGEDRPEDQPTTREIPVVPAGDAGAAIPAAPPLPPHPGALPPAPVAPPEQPAAPASPPTTVADARRETGPVDFVPGPPGAGTTAAPPPPVAAPGSEPTGATAAGATAAGATAAGATAAGATGTEARSWPHSLDADGPAKVQRLRAPQDRATLVVLGLAVVALVLLELGLGLGFGDRSYWSLVPLWSAFATVAALLALVGLVPALWGRAAAPGAPAAGASAAAGAGLAWRIAAGGLVGLAVFWVLVVLPHADTNRGFVLTAALAALGAALWMGPGRSR